jgi:anti-sigma regulatory factor (Ser/Thr protein kinase)
MASTAVQVDPQLIAFTLPSIPESARIARFHVRAALRLHGLDGCGDDAEIVTSELVTNAIQHVCADGTQTIQVSVIHTRPVDMVTVIVSDSSQKCPVKHDLTDGIEGGRGLLIVHRLATDWGWKLADGGKAVYATLAGKADA